MSDDFLESLMNEAKNNPSKIAEYVRQPWPERSFGGEPLQFQVLRRLGPQTSGEILTWLKFCILLDAPTDLAISKLCELLGVFKYAEAVPTLIKIIERKYSAEYHISFGEHPFYGAIFSLGEIGDPVAIAPLSQLRHRDDLQDSFIQDQILISLRKLGIEIQDASAMLQNVETFWRERKRDEALSICDQLESRLDQLDKIKRGGFWFIRAYIILEKYGEKDPRVREYCLRSLAEGLENRGNVWHIIEGKRPLSETTFREAVANTPGLADLKSKLGIIK